MPTHEQLTAFHSLPVRVLSERLLIEQLDRRHVTDTYLTWFSDEEVVKFLEARDLTRESVIEYFEHGARTAEFRLYAICWRETGEHIGNLKLGPINWRHGVSDLVTVIGARSAWGRGVASEAISRGNQLAFDHLGIRKLSGAIYADNIGSVKAYTRAGWFIEGTLKAHCISNGVTVDRILVSCFNPVGDPRGGACQ